MNSGYLLEEWLIPSLEQEMSLRWAGTLYHTRKLPKITEKNVKLSRQPEEASPG